MSPYQWSADLSASGSAFSAAGTPNNAFNGQTGITQGAELMDRVRLFGTLLQTLLLKLQLEYLLLTANCLCEVNDLGSVALTQGDWTEVSNGASLIAIETINGQRHHQQLALTRSMVRYTLMVYPSYGANGLHLDFSDPDDLGADRSGNGNNFTPTGFGTPVGIFSNELTTNGTWESAQTQWCFDGSDLTEGTAITSDNTQCFVEFGPETPINITGQTVQLFTYNQPSTITLGGASTAVTAQGIQNVDVGTATEISATTPLRITHNLINNWLGTAYCLGGTVIVDNMGVNYDSMQDSPTQNFPTFNP